MSSNVTIRTMAGKDILSIFEAWNETLVRDTITVGRLISSIHLDINFSPTDARGCYVAETQGKIVGFIRAIMRLAPNDGLGFEEHDGWISVLFVRPEYQRKTIGTQLLHAALDFLKSHGRRTVWVCGNTGSAPGYIFPGVDGDAYPSGFAFFKKHGFTIDHEPIAMSGDIIDFDYKKCYDEAWSTGREEVVVEALTPERLQDFLAFLATHFKGDWNAAARAKLASGPLDEVLIALVKDTVVGYCQWEGEHFGPFGVRADIRGKKIGAKLFVEAVRRIKAADGRTVWFNWADEDAARFYERFGLHATRKFAIMKRSV